jgi:hypothetical protein
MTVQRIPYTPDEGRVESGAVQFGDDWPGLFIRGDNAFMLTYALTHALVDVGHEDTNSETDMLVRQPLIGLLRMLRDVHGR